MTARQWMLIVWLFLIAFAATAADPKDELFDAIKARDAARVAALIDAEPALVNATHTRGASALTMALFTSGKGGFVPPQKNAVLQTIALRGPKLDLHETAALASSAELASRLDASNVMERTPFGWTPLHYAAFAGNVDNAKLLLDRGADVSSRAKSKFRNTPLAVATLTGQVEVAKLLLARGADVLVRQAEGFTPLHLAALLGNMELVRLYLDHGAEINSRTDDGRTPLSEAMRGKRDAIAELLRTKGAVAGMVGEKIMESPE